MSTNKHNYIDALRTISQALKTVDGIILSLEKAYTLANWDLFSGDSLLFGWLKYKRIAEVEQRLPLLKGYLTILNEELDEMPDLGIAYSQINRTDRLWDTYGDVLFFDIKTRKVIKQNLDYMQALKIELMNLKNTLKVMINHLEEEE